jgi:hypothetical protein
MDAWNTMKRARDLLTMAYCFADKGVEEDSCRDLAQKFATIIDLIENEIDDAMMLVAADKKATQADANPTEAAQQRRSGK